MTAIIPLVTGIFSSLSVPAISGLSSIPVPETFPGLRAWYDASDSSTITLGIGDNIVQIDDKSGNGNHLIQPSVSEQPTLFEGGGETGLDIIEFDGSQYLYKVDPIGVGNNAGNTFMALLVPFSQQSGGVVLANDGGGAGPFQIDYVTSDDVRYFVDVGASSVIATTTVSGYGAPEIVSGRFTGTQVRISEGGTTGTASLSGTTEALPSGKRLVIGSLGEFEDDFFLNFSTFLGTMSEILFYDNDVGATNEATLRSYLSTKWV